MKHQKFSSDLIKIILSALLTACAVNFFFRFDGLAPGGLTGLALVLGTVFKIDVSIMVLIISIPLLLVASKVIGKQFGIKTVIITVLTPLFMKIIPAFWITKPLLSIHPNLELLTSAVSAGLLIGLSITLSIKAGCATGGTDVLAMMIHKVIPDSKLSLIILMLDGIIILSTSLINKNILISVFSALSLAVIVFTIDYFTQKKETQLVR